MNGHLLEARDQLKITQRDLETVREELEQTQNTVTQYSKDKQILYQGEHISIHTYRASVLQKDNYPKSVDAFITQRVRALENKISRSFNEVIFIFQMCKICARN